MDKRKRNRFKPEVGPRGEGMPGGQGVYAMTRKLGFTLVELLVVIAIISILAAIVVPQVQGHILRARMTNAVSTIQTIDTTLVSVLENANKTSFRHMFVKLDPDQPAPLLEPPTTQAEFLAQVDGFTTILYIILRQGRNGREEIKSYLASNAIGHNLTIDEEAFKRLGTSYLADLGTDPWERRYNFWVGPWPTIPDGSGSTVPIPFRGYRPGEELPNGDYLVRVYDAAAKAEMDAKIPGNPKADGRPGFPAPRDKGVYIFSTGVNMQNDQDTLVFHPGDLPSSEKRFWGGGDDINNWDNENGWQSFYT